MPTTIVDDEKIFTPPSTASTHTKVDDIISPSSLPLNPIKAEFIPFTRRRKSTTLKDSNSSQTTTTTTTNTTPIKMEIDCDATAATSTSISTTTPIDINNEIIPIPIDQSTIDKEPSVTENIILVDDNQESSTVFPPPPPSSSSPPLIKKELKLKLKGSFKTSPIIVSTTPPTTTTSTTTTTTTTTIDLDQNSSSSLLLGNGIKKESFSIDIDSSDDEDDYEISDDDSKYQSISQLKKTSSDLNKLLSSPESNINNKRQHQEEEEVEEEEDLQPLHRLRKMKTEKLEESNDFNTSSTSQDIEHLKSQETVNQLDTYYDENNTNNDQEDAKTRIARRLQSSSSSLNHSTSPTKSNNGFNFRASIDLTSSQPDFNNNNNKDNNNIDNNNTTNRANRYNNNNNNQMSKEKMEEMVRNRLGKEDSDMMPYWKMENLLDQYQHDGDIEGAVKACKDFIAKKIATNGSTSNIRTSNSPILSSSVGGVQTDYATSQDRLNLMQDLYSTNKTKKERPTELPDEIDKRDENHWWTRIDYNSIGTGNVMHLNDEGLADGHRQGHERLWIKHLTTSQGGTISATGDEKAHLTDKLQVYFTRTRIGDETGKPADTLIARSRVTKTVIPLLRNRFIRMLGVVKTVVHQPTESNATVDVQFYLSHYAEIVQPLDKIQPSGQEENLYTTTQRINVLEKFLNVVKGSGDDLPSRELIRADQEESLSDTDFNNTNLSQEAPDKRFDGILQEHQSKGLWWMLNRERNPSVSYNDLVRLYWKIYKCDDNTIIYYNNYCDKVSRFAPKTENKVTGGLLCDDMGLGKTVMSLNLILSNHPVLNRNSQHREILAEYKKTSPLATNSMPKTTLIICPAALVFQWEAELKRFIKPPFEIYGYHGNKRNRNTLPFSYYDVVITTHITFGKEFKDFIKGQRTDSPLHQMLWWRIIVDEAQVMKKTSLLFDALQNIESINKWCLSGTPVQNYVDEMFPFLHFLHVYPIASSLFTWRQYVDKDKANGIPRLRTTLKPILLRRTKQNIPTLNLPSKTIETVVLKFHRKESLIYDQLFSESSAILDDLFRRGLQMLNYGYILSLILRLRQVCDHTSLIVRTSQEEEVTTEFCSMCGDILISPFIQGICNHKYCMACVLETFRDQSITQHFPKVKCPECDTQIILDKKLASDYDIRIDKEINIKAAKVIRTLPKSAHRDSEASRIAAGSEFIDDKNSAKLTRMLDDINEAKRNDRDAKIVIFSQWTSMLNRVEMLLIEKNIMPTEHYLRYDGTMTPNAKRAAVETFQTTNGEPRILLISLKAGGVGLNLTRANHVIVLDPWWNSSAEDQAIDRVHRIGQLKHVYVKKYVIQASIEERVLELQRAKESMTKAILDQKYDPTRQIITFKLSIEDIKKLFMDFKNGSQLESTTTTYNNHNQPIQPSTSTTSTTSTTIQNNNNNL
ncbi:SNF2-related domain-containing protein [Cavenderia fasciculata]|uniref:SNF2-related domain-containing protein n=1 Tax=Cavenderia fasciculata TaxID=261658 RepID=F4Q1U3_CACFS|nr:SNF2-related domain-containing protein [Cavenderia fasciculata]EGG17963.1 SNF2-related domain-containing protein [Cavenderia fasciculata]|eukprot:XP_004356855.1 SNF2-related domain-containing protein [Cavenderia fasciculata]